ADAHSTNKNFPSHIPHYTRYAGPDSLKTSEAGLKVEGRGGSRTAHVMRKLPGSVMKIKEERIKKPRFFLHSTFYKDQKGTWRGVRGQVESKSFTTFSTSSLFNSSTFQLFNFILPGS
ncbi:MAG: hypothetical protein JXA62_02060, partial [Candidatus Aminicenantes bacterium]|nr:hypothetical protein [Candidatus Aminicenantes bacterium]